MAKFASRHSRGFTLIELMIVVSLIGILVAIAIPGYHRLIARSHRTEMLDMMSKFKAHFKSVYDAQGTFATMETLPTAASTSAMNPDPALAPIGQPGKWETTRAGWTQIPFGFDGGVRMRYWYVLGPDAGGGKVDEVTFFACGSFPGFGSASLACLDGVTANYQYSETFHAGGNSDEPVELPSGF